MDAAQFQAVIEQYGQGMAQMMTEFKASNQQMLTTVQQMIQQNNQREPVDPLGIFPKFTTSTFPNLKLGNKTEGQKMRLIKAVHSSQSWFRKELFSWEDIPLDYRSSLPSSSIG